MSELNIKDKDGFVDTFLKYYLNGGFGSLNKSDIDTLVMHLLMQYCDDLKNDKNYELSIKLKITEARVKSIKHKAKLQFLLNNDADNYIKGEFFALLHRAKLQGESKQGASAKIIMVIEDLYVKQGIQGKLKSLGHFADNSFNSEIVKISQESFIDLLEDFFSDDERKELVEKVKKAIPDKNSIEFKTLLKEFLAGAANKSGEKFIDFSVLFATGGISEITTWIDKIQEMFESK